MMNDGGLKSLTEGLLKKDFSKDSNKNENKKIKKNTLDLETSKLNK